MHVRSSHPTDDKCATSLDSDMIVKEMRLEYGNLTIINNSLTPHSHSVTLETSDGDIA